MSDKRQKYSELLLKMKPYDGTETTDVSLQIIDYTLFFYKNIFYKNIEAERRIF